MNDAHSPEQQLAIRCSESLHSRDQTAAMLGISIESSTPGKAVMRMTVRKDMTNGHAICHGGMIFTLADTAFAHACNNTNAMTVASACHIDFVAPAFVDDVLTGTAQERSRSGRTGIYDIDVTKQDGSLIAVFRGKSHQINGQVIPAES